MSLKVCLQWKVSVQFSLCVLNLFTVPKFINKNPLCSGYHDFLVVTHKIYRYKFIRVWTEPSFKYNLCAFLHKYTYLFLIIYWKYLSDVAKVGTKTKNMIFLKGIVVVKWKLYPFIYIYPVLNILRKK